MPGSRITYFIIIAFITGNLALIFMQYNSTKNISKLISGNEQLLNEFNVNSELKELETNVISIENKVRGIVTTRDSSNIEGIALQIGNVEKGLDNLQKINDDDSSVKYIDFLDRLVRQKLVFSQQILDTLANSGKTAAESMIATQIGKKITDSIIFVTRTIFDARQKLLSDVTHFTNESGKKAQEFGSILIFSVLIGGTLLFAFIINTIRKQNLLIQQLNISENKERRAAQIKENFLANMSHEIRTPMHAILGFTNLLQHKELDMESKEYVQTIQRSGENLLAIINDILDLSKIEAGMMRIESGPFSIRGLVHSIETLFQAKAKEKHLTINSSVDDLMPDTLEGDAIRLSQILVNLIGNAIKFTSKGGIEISITNDGNEGNIINTCIAIKDTGIGIEKENLSAIFERFQQAEDSVTRKYGGTGLGLSIVNDLVKLQKGMIHVDSEHGSGTLFKLTIPYRISSTQITLPRQEIYRSMFATDFKNSRILVVEDNEINQKLVKHIFQNWRLSYDLVGNGREALDILTKSKYDLVLMDIQMPEMDGYTATAEIRHKLKLSVPIIAMTAHALAGEREKCLGFGMNEYISKPIREEQLYKLIARFIHLDNQEVNKSPIECKIASPFKYIDLHYMTVVSNGNREYEKAVTEAFIESIPVDLETIEKAWADQNIPDLRKKAHDMKTTVSIMGLDEQLATNLDALEYHELDEEFFQKHFFQIKSVCQASLVEARLFYGTL